VQNKPNGALLVL